ncbi:MAG: hypothetical protein AAEJ52_01810 [Myxococcota bacterium]
MRNEYGLVLFAAFMLLAGGLEVARGTESSSNRVSRYSFDLPPSVRLRSDGVSVYRKEIVSKVYTVDQLYKSMQGPQSMHSFDLAIGGPAELLWLTGYESEIVGADADTEVSSEFMCHNDLLIDTNEYHKRFPTKIRTAGERVFDLAQGQHALQLPDGFGIPWMSNQKLNFNSNILNHNRVGETIEVRVKVAVEYIRDADLPRPLKPLVQRGAFGMKLLEGPDGHYGDSFDAVSLEDHGPGCSVGEDAEGSGHRTISDSEGRIFTGFWVVKPGRETNHTRITPQLNVPYDTTLHYVSVHLHPFGESLALRDLTTGETLYESRARQVESGLGLAAVEHFSSEQGIPIFKDHEYELVSVYNNTSGEDQDAMTTMFLYLHAKDLYDFDFRPRPK